MCTLTIVRELNQLLVTMNRDDLAARREAPPSLWRSADTAFAAPKDLQAGGTWIGVNEAGVVACLLNRYDAAPTGRVSRGQIVIEAMAGRNREQACAILAHLEHGAFSPFTAVVIDRLGATQFDWTGARFERTDLADMADLMLTSSSWQYERVRTQREALFREVWSSDGDTLDRVASFHSARESAKDAWAPMMQRPHSQTKSITQVELVTGAAEMRYWTRDGALSRRLTAPDSVVTLPSRGQPRESL